MLVLVCARLALTLREAFQFRTPFIQYIALAALVIRLVSRGELCKM